MSSLGERRSISLVLLVVALGLLFAGRFIQFDDTSGVGSQRWILPLGPLALVAAVASVIVAWPAPKARLWLGVALALLTAALVWANIANDGFRFIWNGDEGEFAIMEIVAGVVALVMIAVGAYGLGKGRWLLRAAAYLGGTFLLTFAMVIGGIGYYESTCGVEEECFSLLGGFLWGAVAVASCVLAVVVIETVLWRRRRRSH
jgi:hypothetical protein